MTKIKAHVLSVGIINILSGKTMYDWGIYDEGWKDRGEAYLTGDSSLILGAPGSLEIGDKVTLVGNDSGRKLKHSSILDKCITNQEEMLKMLEKHDYNYRPIRAFRARPKNNRKLITSYSLKGVEVIA